MPRPETLQVLAQALSLSPLERTQLAAAAYPQSIPFSPEQQVATRPPTVPVVLTPLVGREHEEAGIARLVRRKHVRLLTLTGPGGVGKTRLAVQIAAGLGDVFGDGIVFVPLALVDDPTLLLPTIAQTLGLRDAGMRPLRETVVDALQGRDVLLVLDNFEHLLPAAPSVVALLAACPRLVALVTSRAALRVQGEQEWAVPPLAVPNPDALPPLATLRHAPAVALFVQRAQAVQPAFALDEANAPAVATLCRHLDGLPLAIELAAAWIKVFPPPALLARLDAGSMLAVLTRGGQDMPARHRTLRDAIAWSYQLLPEREQALFRPLSVFAGGCTLEAAEVVATTVPGEAGAPVRGASVWIGLAALVDHSLLRTEEQPDGEPRFAMLETIRQYGLEQLAAHGEAEETRRRHTAYYTHLAETTGPAFEGPDRVAWLDYLDREHDNLRAAVRWILHTGAGDLGLRLGAALGHFRGSPRVHQGRRRSSRGLSRTGWGAPTIDGLGAAPELCRILCRDPGPV